MTDILETELPVAEKRFYSLKDLANLPKPEWLIEGMFEVESLVMLAGPSYSFKSFLMTDWMLCMASGRNWLGKATKPSKVAYTLGEGKSGVYKRIQAWINHNKLTSEERDRLEKNFRVSFAVPQMCYRTEVDRLLADLAGDGFNPEVICIDTLARSIVGKNENDAMDAGTWVESADRLRQLGHTVVVLHHTKKNTEFGVQYRGSSAIMGAMDTAMMLVREGAKSPYSTLSITKQKDHDEGKPIRLERVIVPVGYDTSCVLVPAQQETEIEELELPVIAVDQDALETELIADPKYKTDADRAREFARQTGCKISTAKSRFSRHKPGVAIPVALSDATPYATAVTISNIRG